MLFRVLITFLPRSKHLLISWLQSPSAVILEPQKIKSAIVSPSICHEVMEPDAMIFIFWMLSFKPTFSLSSFTFIKRLFSSSSLSAIRVVSSAYLMLCIIYVISAYYLYFKYMTRTSLVVQWLKLHVPMQGVWVWSLMGELRSHMPSSQNNKTWDRSRT